MQNGGQVLACPPSANIQLYGSSILHPKGKQWFYIFKYASRKPGIWAAKNPDKIGVFAEHIFFMFLLWPARRDSNPRPSESESAAISSFATGGYIIILIQIILIFNSKNFLCNSLLLKYAYIALFEKVCLALFLFAVIVKTAQIII